MSLEDDEEYEDESSEEEYYESDYLPVVTSVKADFNFIKMSQIETLIDSEIKPLTSLQLSRDVVIMMAVSKNWNISKASEAFFDMEDKFLMEVGAIPSPASKALKSASPRNPDGKSFTCGCCCDVYPISNEFSLSCNHVFCKQCTKECLEESAINAQKCLKINCLLTNCNMVFGLSQIKSFLKDNILKRFLYLFYSKFLDIQRDLRVCPSAAAGKKCDFILKRVNNEATEALCKCGSRFCFNCVRPIHSPVPCKLLDAWNDKVSGDGLNEYWIYMNVRTCPKCKFKFIKEQFCDIITCPPPCHFEFCYMCLIPCPGHKHPGLDGKYYCNVKEWKPSEKENDPMKSVQHFHNYFDRFNNYNKNLTEAEKKKEIEEQLMREYGEAQLKNKKGISDGTFIAEGISVLIDAYKILRNSYIIGYYMVDNAQKSNIFMLQQTMIADSARQLYHMLDVTGDKIDRQTVIPFVQSLKTFLSKITSYCNGYDIKFYIASK